MDKIKEELLKDLVRFLANQWVVMDRARYEAARMNSIEEARHHLLMKVPVIQGTRNQMDLKKIGEQEFKSENLRKAVDLLLTKD